MKELQATFSPKDDRGGNGDPWESYFQKHAERPPRPIVVEAVAKLRVKDSAIDIGAGPLRNTKYLLAEGFVVTAFDTNPKMIEVAAALHSEKLIATVDSLENFDYGENKFDIAIATCVLHQCSKEKFGEVLLRIKRSIRQGGIFCAILLGDKDSWSSRTRHTKTEVEAMFADMEDVSIVEHERDDVDAGGRKKHWHEFAVIARKK